MRAVKLMFLSLLAILIVASSGWPLDGKTTHVILLLDASGSMKKTDPLNLRLDAGELFVRLLDRRFSLSILSFHSRVDIVSLEKDPVKERRLLLKRLRGISSNGLYTDIYTALKDVLELTGQQRGRTVVVLLSDGRMDTGNPDRDREKTSLIRKNLLPLAKTRNIPIYTVAFSELSDRKLLKEIAVKTDALSFMVKNAREIHQAFTRIFNEIQHPDSLPINNKGFLVDNSIEDINIIVTKADPNRGVVLEDPGGNRYTSRKHPPYMRWYSTLAFEMIGMGSPQAGRWKIHFSASEGNQIFILTDLKLRTKAVKNLYSTGDKIVVETWLEEKGKRLDNIPILLRNIDFSASLNTRGRLIKKMVLKDDGVPPDRLKNDGVYTDTVSLDQTGEFLLRVVARGKTFERKVEKIFSVIEGDRGFSKKKDIEIETIDGSSTPEIRDKKEGDGYSWRGVILNFFIINIAAGLTVLIVIAMRKRDRAPQYLKDLLSRSKSLIKRRKDED